MTTCDAIVTSMGCHRPGYVNSESDAEDPGYIIVLPEGETNQSRASTPSSDVLHDYENVPEKKDAAPASHSPTLQSADGEEDDREYLNVDPLHFQRSTPESSAQSDSDDDEDDDDDDEGNYVNVHEGTQTD
ncbi:linker for activation of T-cells family member 1-like [Chaetodon trifascialis]|uniref:linker for activation of T-cells family member 1-like n=1 Tax=Chaetodon trifascialis TaxID=109706 RepID=UPI0039961BC3